MKTNLITSLLFNALAILLIFHCKVSQNTITCISLSVIPFIISFFTIAKKELQFEGLSSDAAVSDNMTSLTFLAIFSLLFNKNIFHFLSFAMINLVLISMQFSEEVGSDDQYDDEDHLINRGSIFYLVFRTKFIYFIPMAILCLILSLTSVKINLFIIPIMYLICRENSGLQSGDFYANCLSNLLGVISDISFCLWMKNLMANMQVNSNTYLLIILTAITLFKVIKLTKSVNILQNISTISEISIAVFSLLSMILIQYQNITLIRIVYSITLKNLAGILFMFLMHTLIYARSVDEDEDLDSISTKSPIAINSKSGSLSILGCYFAICTLDLNLVLKNKNAVHFIKTMPSNFKAALILITASYLVIKMISLFKVAKLSKNNLKMNWKKQFTITQSDILILLLSVAGLNFI